MASSGRPNVTEVELDPTRIEPGINHFRVSLRASFSDEDIIAVNCISTLQRGDGSVQFEGLLSLYQGDSSRNGRWSGEVSIPSNMPDGDYSVYCGIFARGSGPGSLRPLSNSMLGNITLQRTTIPDNIPPQVTAPTVEPRIIGGPSNTDSYISVSATASDDMHVMLVYAIGIQVSGPSSIGGPPDAPYMSLEEGNFENGNGRWSGRLHVHRWLANGEYRIDFYAFDAKGNFAQSSESPTIRIERADVVSPTIVASSIAVEPQILRPRESQVALSVRATDREGVQSVVANVMPSSTGSSQIGSVNLQRSGGTAVNGIWTGSFVFPPNAADGEYRITFNAADMAGNSTSGGLVGVTLQRQGQGQHVPPTESSTTFTFPGPASIRNVTSESGECEVRVSVPQRVVIDCECPQKSANRDGGEEGTRREQQMVGQSRIPLPRIPSNKNTVMLILSIVFIVIAGGILAASISYIQHDNKCNSWLTGLQNQILGLFAMTQLNEGPSQTQDQTNRINTMAAEYNTEKSRFNEECGTR